MLITPLSDGEGQAAKRRGGGASYSSDHSLPALRGGASREAAWGWGFNCPGYSLPSPTGRGKPRSGVGVGL